MPLLLKDILFWVLPLKTKSVTKFSVLISLPRGMLVYNNEKSYVETDLAAFRLPSFFKVSITGLLF